MPTYVGFVRLTEKGSKDVRYTLDRARQFWGRIEQLGGVVVQHLWLQGERDDAIIIFEMTELHVVQALIFEVNSLGNVQFRVSAAFVASELIDILARVPSNDGLEEGQYHGN